MTTIAITGVAGHVGRRLLAALDLRPDIDRIVGLDVVAPRRVGSSKLTFRQTDIRDPGLDDALRGVDVVVHLVRREASPHGRELVRSTNVDGALNVARAARAAGVGRVVYISSVFAYGAHPDNDLPLTERSPLRGTPGLDVADHVREVETQLLRGAQDTVPEVAVLRFAMVVGGGMDNVITRLLESPRLVTVRGHRPPLQFLHIDDAVRAILHTIDRQLTGVYNVCAEGWLSFDEVTAIASKNTVEVPEEVAFSAAERLWKLGVGEHPPGMVAHLMHPWVMAPDAFIATGWRPYATNRDALAETTREHAGYVALGGARAARRSVVRAVGSVVAGFAVVWFVRRSFLRRRAGSQGA